jgi:CRP/FNR family transcriptional regulator
MIRRRYGRDASIFHEGEVGDTFHVIEKGRVLVAVSTAAGDVAALSVRGPGEILGELALVGGGRRTAAVRALEPTETLSLTQDGLDELRAEMPDVDRFMLEIVTAKLAETTEQLMEVLFVPVDTRVLRVVLRLVDVFDGGADPVTIRVRQEDIAAMAGTRRQTANRPLQEAQRAGALRTARGRIEVLDRELLARLAR